jgi:hypothetical protein
LVKLEFEKMIEIMKMKKVIFSKKLKEMNSSEKRMRWDESWK